MVIPAFAVDRTELVLLALAGLLARGAIPDVPIYVDSPMALRALEVYRDPALQDEVLPGRPARSPAAPAPSCHGRREESMRLNTPG